MAAVEMGNGGLAEAELAADTAIIHGFKGEVLNAVKFGAAVHMKKSQVKEAPSWAWGDEQKPVAMAEPQGVTLKVHCSRHGTVHQYGTSKEQKWLYFDE